MRWIFAALVAVALGGACGGGTEERAGATAQAWSAAIPPVRVRSDHTATLLGSGQVLLAGGVNTPTQIEILDPYRGTIELLATTLSAPRVAHSATLLQSGLVLLAGGQGQASAELFDPVARTVRPTASMSQERPNHPALRLPDGRVLVASGSTAEIFDPATETWTATSARTTTSASALATLEDGRILLVGTASSNDAETYDPVSGRWARTGPQRADAHPFRTLTRVRNGRVVGGTIDSCAGVSNGDIICTPGLQIFDPSSRTFAPGPISFTNRESFTSALLPNGDVLFAGGSGTPETRQAERFNGSTLVSDGALVAPHRGNPTATLLPGGDVLVMGGDQSTIDLRPWLPIETPAGPLRTGRKRHAGARLLDGRVLLAGGIRFGVGIAAAELYDPATSTTTPAGNMLAAREYPTLTTLRSGDVLVVGGATAELYTPGAGFRLTGAPRTPRGGHAATLLPTGEVLITGGCAGVSCTSTELYDPATGAFAEGPPLRAPRVGHGSALIESGEVLVVSGGTAELFDPKRRTFFDTTPPGASRDGRTLRALVNGKVFVGGGPTLAAELYDPATRSWSFTPALPAALDGRRFAPLPSGQLLGLGGVTGRALGTVVGELVVYDPLASRSGIVTSRSGDARIDHTFTLTGAGDVLATGGDACRSECGLGSFDLDAAKRFGEGASVRPTITAVPSTVTAGSRVTVFGTRFTDGPEGSSGNRASSAANVPIVTWVSANGDAVVPGTVVAFTRTSATWLVAATAFHGPGMLFVSSSAATSTGAPVTILPAPVATSCRYDGECALGFCVDGVCCDRACNGRCEGCSAKVKGSGEDGVCGAVPANRTAGRCVLENGEACTSDVACASNHCSPQGVCCDAACTGECQSCNQAGAVGTCRPIRSGACTAVCDGQHTLKQVGADDFDCTPYRCEGASCKTACASARDCVAPSVCNLQGQCVASPTFSADDVVVFGCSAGARRAPGAPLSVGILALLAVARHRRRRARGDLPARPADGIGAGRDGAASRSRNAPILRGCDGSSCLRCSS